MILVIDNYDSFTYNLVQYLSEMERDIEVIRNDVETAEALLARSPERIVISPGPGRPEDAGVSCEVIRRASNIPLLGVCLGHQALGLVFGGRVARAKQLMHGKTSEIHHRGEGIFRNLPNPFTATRYHSLVVEREGLPGELRVTAETVDGTIMGLKHESRPLFGVQFHPESILTPEGKTLLRNFVEEGRA